MNNTTDSSHFSNGQLHKYLSAFLLTLSSDAVWDVFKMLIESLQFALLKGENPIHLSKRIRRERPRKEPSSIKLSPNQAKLDIAEIKQLRALAKARPSTPGARKLDAHRQEIIMLRQNGASQMDIKYWLSASKVVTVSQPTIHRYLIAIESIEPHESNI